MKLLKAQQMAYLHISSEWAIVASEFFAIIDMTFPFGVLTSTLHAKKLRWEMFTNVIKTILGCVK